jgi:hypothetical protein
VGVVKGRRELRRRVISSTTWMWSIPHLFFTPQIFSHSGESLITTHYVELLNCLTGWSCEAFKSQDYDPETAALEQKSQNTATVQL